MRQGFFNGLAGLLVLGLLANWTAAREVHFLCHTHDDLGWLKTIDEYYDETVGKIFKTTIEGLEASQTGDDRLKRKFAYAEVGFLKIFLQREEAAKGNGLSRLQELTKKGQWEWINGGVSQADSACTSFEDLALNFFSGQRFLKKHFGVTSKIMWQIDPFGHTQGLTAVAHHFGMRHAFFTRIPNTLKAEWTLHKGLQFIWRLPSGAEMVSHIAGEYNPPASLACDTDCDVGKFSQKSYRTSCALNDMVYRKDYFYFVGDDFQWSAAPSRFVYLDHVLSLNPDSRYSTPEEYTRHFDAQHSRQNLPVFQGDFLVYTTGWPWNFNAWSGFYTTKPLLKYRIRQVQKMLRAVKSVVATSGFWNGRANFSRHVDSLSDVGEEVSLLLHHDTITGTSTERVDQDYFRRISNAEKEIRRVWSESLQPSEEVMADDGSLDQASAVQFEFCDANEVIAGTKNACDYFGVYSEGGVVLVETLGSLNSRSDSLHRFLVPDAGEKYTCLVQDGSGKDVNSLYFCGRRQGFCEVWVEEKYNLDPKSRTRWFLKKVEKKADQQQLSTAPVTDDGERLDLGEFEVAVSRSSVSYTQKSSEPTEKMSFSYHYLEAGDAGRYFLAYATKPFLKPYGSFTKRDMVVTNFTRVIHLTGDKVDMTLIWWTGTRAIQVETLVKKVPDFSQGIEVLLAVNSTAISNDHRAMVTDSNGLFEIERFPGLRLEDSVFPVTAFARVSPANGKQGLEVFNDRPQGAYATTEGLVFYLQRSARTADILAVRENVLMQHWIRHTDTSYPSGEFWDLRYRQDTFREHLYSNAQSGILADRSAQSWSLGIGNDFPFVRFTFELVDDKKALVRVWNISPRDSADLPIRRILADVLPKASFMVVENSYVFGTPEVSQQLPDQITLKPYEAVTIVYSPLS